MLRIRTMTRYDVTAAMRLNHEAGWNQVTDDWHRFLSIEPEGCFVADIDGQLVGTTVTCVFGSIAWMAMVLVSPVRRGDGIGTGLTQHAVGWLEERGVDTIRLDATPLGLPMYERLNFVPQFELARYAGRPVQIADNDDATETPAQEELARMIEFDQKVTCTFREKWLTALFAAWPDAVRLVRANGEIQGFVAARRGAHASQVGPCLARGEAGPRLFHHIARRYAGEAVLIDVPVPNVEAGKHAELMGLRVERHLVRMCRGKRVQESVEHLWSSSGPELG